MLTVDREKIDFIKDEFGIDLTGITLINKVLKGANGRYSTKHKGVIFIDQEKLNTTHELFTHLTIMHELFHLLQHEFDISLSLDLKSFDTYFYDAISEDWNENPLEVDARFFELYYLWKKGVPKDKLIELGKYKFNEKVTDRLEFCAYSIENKEFQTVINEMIDSMRSDKILYGMDKEYERAMIDDLM